MQVTVATLSRLLGLWVWIPRGHGCLSVLSVVCCQVEVSVLGWSRVRGSPNEGGVPQCDRRASIMGMPWPTRCCCAMKNCLYGHNVTQEMLSWSKVDFFLKHAAYLLHHHNRRSCRCQNSYLLCYRWVHYEFENSLWPANVKKLPTRFLRDKYNLGK